ncbi:putative tRNA(Thr) (cytosine(32)-N(3))-methyltransferase [Helianthus annuus]|nr:putative tRNA(Thr) (cytosine(32)-N(3))-methyltransferase [Helianthus annuus]
MAAVISVTPLVPYTRKRRPRSAVKLQCYKGVEEDRKQWEKFYERHQNKFFKDRHYLEKDWGHYFCHPKVLLEAGCGAGNTIFPLAKKYPQLYIHACDFSHHAVTLVKSHPNFRKDQINVFVCNIAEENLCDHIMPASVDIVTLVFTLSAVSPEKMPIIIENLGLVLKPNGHVVFRDYAIGDYAQTMLMNKKQVISENFYFRGDGTCSYYFSEDFLSRLFERAGFVVVDVNTYNKEIINRARNITMQRRWIRAVFRRP